MPPADFVERYHRGYVVPELLRPWLLIALTHKLQGRFEDVLRSESPLTLRAMAQVIAETAVTDPYKSLREMGFLDLPPTLPLFEMLGLPCPEWGQGYYANMDFWAGQVLPSIRKELERRELPAMDNTNLKQLKARLDIVTVVGQLVKLEPSGRGYKGLCPFHAEKSPSFYVWGDTQRWKCFGACAVGGDVIDFLLRVRDGGHKRPDSAANPATRRAEQRPS